MPLFIDVKYAKLVGSSLDGFHQVKDNLFLFRCPFCGDSTHSKTKMRGYFYAKHEGEEALRFKCHNCGLECSMRRFLLMASAPLAQDYDRETWEHRPSKRRARKQPQQAVKPPERDDDPAWGFMVPLERLPNGHPTREYVEQRRIPRAAWRWLCHTDDFARLASEIDPSQDLKRNEPRLVIPVLDQSGRLLAVQGRSLPGSDTNAKYITIRRPGQTGRLWYGLWKIDRNAGSVIVFEGPLDSLFIEDSVAMLGLGQGIDAIPACLEGRRLVFALDNQRRHKEVVEQMGSLIKAGHSVCFWPSYVHSKDVNDMVLDEGYTPAALKDIIRTSAKSGLEAELELAKWRGIDDGKCEKARSRKNRAGP